MTARGLAHELRHPINAVRFSLASALSRIEKMEPEGARREVLQIGEEIKMDLVRLDEIIEAFLRYARPEERAAAPFDLRESCDAAARFVQADLANRDIRLEVDKPEAPVIVYAPKIHLLQVLMNLLLNAADATEPGSRIAVRLSRQKRRAVLEVRDEGSGVPEDQAGQIFDPFFSTKEGGAGLGLAICRRLVNDAGGDIAYRPASPKGSVFTVVLPLYRERK